jgi:hypothetical protein
MPKEPEKGLAPQAKAGLSDKISAYLLAGMIAIWLAAYVFFAIRAWLG